jgi:hypothetical protein
MISSFGESKFGFNEIVQPVDVYETMGGGIWFPKKGNWWLLGDRHF